MAASPFDSLLYRDFLHDDEVGRLFGDDAELDAMIRVEAALARVQGKLGIIPEASARQITQALRDLHIEPASIAAGTRVAGIPVPALVAALGDEMQAPEHSQYLHHGATSQDIMDTGLVLRLRGICDIIDARLRLLLSTLADLATTHAQLPLTARTRRQPATPTSFGAVIAAWGMPLIGQLETLAQIRPRLLRVSLAGAAGNSSALGENAVEQRAALAAELEIADSELPWHSDRSTLAEFASLLTRINGALAKLGEDCVLGAQAEVGELVLAAGGGSSTMPHKQNPVQAEALLGLFQLSAALDGAMTQALLHRQQRDGAAWMLEWHALPQICMACGRALQLSVSMVAQLQPLAERMRANLEGRHGLVYAEAISFRLAERMPRTDAQARVRQLCADAVQQGARLSELIASEYPGIEWGDVTEPTMLFGDAPQQARIFADRVHQL
ncbi:MAG: adenylosuccinate lyase family protein [Gammaproteobacteria bacterium]|nr:adenylosuccinate lyase family protein [Gammaproteobacteria bacterium]